ncbi:hypothetical protein BpHYR1_041085 [Brachionus plicatilis]|uniref:Uncharacterized protein n=1 Tax=Brachionus plicatilis TaxID=10195 RepID=A0A3M7R6L9_BRAPC|nr:hypothetical protein BpHYR1_041085 [Brachionus plicatilis]
MFILQLNYLTYKIRLNKNSKFSRCKIQSMLDQKFMFHVVQSLTDFETTHAILRELILCDKKASLRVISPRGLTTTTTTTTTKSSEILTGIELNVNLDRKKVELNLIDQDNFLSKQALKINRL